MFGALAPNFFGQRLARSENGKQSRPRRRIPRDMAGNCKCVGRKRIEINLAQSDKPFNLFGNRREYREWLNISSWSTGKPIRRP